MGRGEKNVSDQAAVDAMRRAFDTLHIQGTVVIGEGERDEAPMLYIGEKVGRWAPDDPGIDIALDPLEGTNLCAYGRPGAIAVVALAERGKLLNAPDTYMEKLAVGPAGARGDRHAQEPHREPPRHRPGAGPRSRGPHGGHPRPSPARGARSARSAPPVHASGSSRTATWPAESPPASRRPAWTCDGDRRSARGCHHRRRGQVGRRRHAGATQDAQRRGDRARRRMGITDFDRIYTAEELAQGEVMFAATGVTSSDFLRGVRFFGGGAETWSVVMRSKTGTVRYVQAQHRFEKKPEYLPARREGPDHARRDPQHRHRHAAGAGVRRDRRLRPLRRVPPRGEGGEEASTGGATRWTWPTASIS